MCKSPKRASTPFFFGYVAQNLGGGENSVLDFTEFLLKNDRFLVLENDRILVWENDRFLVGT